jgi:hypothetical protein
MRKILFTSFLLWACFSFAFARPSSADAQMGKMPRTVADTTAIDSVNYRIGDMLNTNRIYELSNFYRTVDTTKVLPVMRLMVKAVVGSKTNRYNESCLAIEALLNHHTQELVPSNVSSLVGLLVQNLNAMRDFRKAMQVMKPYVDAGAVGEDSRLTYRYWQALDSVPALRVTKPDCDFSLPVTFKKMGRGEEMYVDVTIGGEREPFIFDTGCNLFNFVSERFARRHHLRTVFDSLSTSGFASGYCKVAVADSMRLGPVLVQNPVFLVSPDSMQVDSFYIDAVLGTWIIEQLGEAQYHSDGPCLLIPKVPSANPAGAGNLIYDGAYYLYADVLGTTTRLHFDTGNARTAFGKTFLAAHKDFVYRNGKVHQGRMGGFGGMTSFNSYETSNIPITIGAATSQLPLVDVMDSDAEFKNGESGRLGTDFLKAFKKVTMNFTHMFVLAE